MAEKFKDDIVVQFYCWEADEFDLYPLELRLMIDHDKNQALYYTSRFDIVEMHFSSDIFPTYDFNDAVKRLEMHLYEIWKGHRFLLRKVFFESDAELDKVEV